MDRHERKLRAAGTASRETTTCSRAETPVIAIHNVPRIAAPLPGKAILRRLQYHARSTIVPPLQMRGVESIIRIAETLCRPRGRFARLDVQVETPTVFCRGVSPIRSGTLAGLLAQSRQAAILGVTLGADIVERIGYLIEEQRFVEGVIHDAVASEMAEAAMNYLHNYVRQERSRFGQGVTRRYSPGYRDFSLACQQTLYEALRMGELGVDLSPRHVLIPEKSALAVVGIEDAS